MSAGQTWDEAIRLRVGYRSEVPMNPASYGGSAYWKVTPATSGKLAFSTKLTVGAIVSCQVYAGSDAASATLIAYGVKGMFDAVAGTTYHLLATANSTYPDPGPDKLVLAVTKAVITDWIQDPDYTGASPLAGAVVCRQTSDADSATGGHGESASPYTSGLGDLQNEGNDRLSEASAPAYAPIADATTANTLQTSLLGLFSRSTDVGGVSHASSGVANIQAIGFAVDAYTPVSIYPTPELPEVAVGIESALGPSDWTATYVDRFSVSGSGLRDNVNVDAATPGTTRLLLGDAPGSGVELDVVETDGPNLEPWPVARMDVEGTSIDGDGYYWLSAEPIIKTGLWAFEGPNPDGVNPPPGFQWDWFAATSVRWEMQRDDWFRPPLYRYYELGAVLPPLQVEPNLAGDVEGVLTYYSRAPE